MRKLVWILFVGQLSCVWPIASSAQTKPEVILTIPGEEVSKDEFVRLYQKNNQFLPDDSLRKSPEEYMDLFINYKLKVIQAQDLGLDTLAAFRKEYKQYRDQLAEQYLKPADFSDELYKQAYDRMCTEVKAAHILIQCTENASPAEVEKARDRCLDIRARVLAGADFESMAMQYSDDPSAKQNKGILGYFTAFQMVPEFEEAAFKLAAGELSQPVRSKFGFHLIYLYDKRPNAGKIQVAHIMKQLPPNASELSVKKAFATMDSIRVLATNGADFSALAKTESDDRSSAAKGGILPYFTATGMIPEFAEASFALKQDGDISPVIRTSYGFHLIKRIDLKPMESIDVLKPIITDRFRSNPVVTIQKQEAFVDSLKQVYHFEEDREAVQKILDNYLLQDRNKPLTTEFAAQELFRIDGKAVAVADFQNYLDERLLKPGQVNSYSVNQLYAEFTQSQLLKTEDNHLEENYPEFNYLTKEYHDGILLFNLSEQMVWDKAVQDSVGLAKFYAGSKKTIQWDKRFEGWVIQCRNQDVRDFIDDIFAEDSKMSKEELNEILRTKFENQAFVQKGIFARGDNPLVDYLVWEDAKPESYQEGLHFIRGNMLPPTAKTLEEARGQYVSAYQDELEKQWIKSLRKQYKFKVNKQVLKTVENIQ